MRQRKRISVSGRVQGVGFRLAAHEAAEQLGIAGWVRNVADGTVEAVAEGDAQAVESFVAWCRQGPRSARVAAVEAVEEAPRGEQGFEIRRTWRPEGR